MKKIILLIFYFGIALNTIAQNNRLNTSEKISWYNYFGTFKLTKKLGIHTEYQFRRANFVTDWQQSLVRVGINYQLKPTLLFRTGYAWIETYPYGEYSINGFGKDFTEHRLFQMLQLSHKEDIFEFSHRYIVEQRFVGKYSSVNLNKEDEYPLLHRIRYMFRVQFGLNGKEIKDKIPYMAIYNELFVGFGKNVNANIFDQNRVGILIGYKYNKKFKFEAGYLNQIIQFGRQVNGKNIFQTNNGFILNTYLSLDFSKKE